ncbi:hypothetical protein B0T20DRAFT_218297 [Sordaria brevicollis]|uniref:Alpha-type protein kinase domain-containing protein n=1 Tax=Sordaria brevicollis TaxID=83679 RepID=A0AAE0PF08_SORBR|nr:hypothetical protein B0T20DRAFT_218297 [Sordaria brevicollis]
MRLLNTTSLELETFVGDVPAYSILSHTWSEEEVTFKDLNPIDPALFGLLSQVFEGHTNNPFKLEGNKNQYISPHVKQKKGWEKITKACAHAASQESKYIWIDTCCIDKSDISELSEAINSMFRWYQAATKCYAYLADVTGVSFPKNGEPSEKASVFRASKWFTRGWTLQELLAPKVLEFLDGEWNVIGSRDNWAIEIEKATHIQRQHLREFRHCCLATKLSWAANRQTTRIEDQSYSLLGLLGVHMPLIYGEGEHAFTRLQHELIRTFNDESIFVWKSRRAALPPGEKTSESRATRSSTHLPRTPWFIQRLTFSQSWDLTTTLQHNDAAVLAPSLKCFAGSTGLQIYRHDARFRFEMTNAGLSINVELFRSIESASCAEMVYLVRLNCSQAPPSHMAHSVASAKVLLLRGVHFDSTFMSNQLNTHGSVPTAFRKIRHRSLDWQRVNPGLWVSLGRHDILILNGAAQLSSHLSSLLFTNRVYGHIFRKAKGGTSYHVLKHHIAAVVAGSASRTITRTYDAHDGTSSSQHGDDTAIPALGEGQREPVDVVVVMPPREAPTNLECFEEAFTVEAFSIDAMALGQGSNALNAMMDCDSEIRFSVLELTLRTHKIPFAQGERHVASYARTEASTNRYVVKTFKDSQESRLAYLAEDMRCQALCKAFALEFNALLDDCREHSIDFVVTACFKGAGAGSCSKDGFMPIEPYLDGNFVKYNNNAGYVNEDLGTNPSHLAAQAFSHFTYERSRGRFLVCDLQGVGEMMTDPAIHTSDPERFKLSSTNLGLEGFQFFFAFHECNMLCQKLGLKSDGEGLFNEIDGVGSQVFREEWPTMPDTTCCSNKLCGKILPRAKKTQSDNFPGYHWCGECLPQLETSKIMQVCTGPGKFHRFEVSPFFFESQGMVTPTKCAKHLGDDNIESRTHTYDDDPGVGEGGYAGGN